MTGAMGVSPQYELFMGISITDEKESQITIRVDFEYR
jgi:hypothetical protein